MSQAGRLGDPWLIAQSAELPRVTDPEAVRHKVAEAYHSVGWVLDGLEEDAALLSDVLLYDCPIVGASRGFTALTGYTHDDLIGSNCRVLLKGVPEVAISKSVRKNLRNFCNMCSLRSLDQISEVYSLQPNSRRDGPPFMNFIFIGRVTVHNHPYLLGVQRNLGDGICARRSSQQIADAAEESRMVFKRLRRRIQELDRATSPRLRSPRTWSEKPGFKFYSERLQDHCLLLDEGRTVMRREPQELATNCMVFGNRPVRHTPCGLFFALRVNDAVATFEGLPVVGFTKREPRDNPDLYPTVSRCLGASVLIGACGEAFARDQHHHFKIGFKPPPPEEVRSWSNQPNLPAHKRRPPVGVQTGDVLGCLYTSAGRIQLWRNGVLVLDFDSERPIDRAANYYAVADVCLSAYSVTVLPQTSLEDDAGDNFDDCPEPGAEEEAQPKDIDYMVSRIVNQAFVMRAITAVVADCNFCVTIADPRAEGIPLIAISASFEEMTGYSRNEILGVNCRFLNQGCPISPLDLVGLRIACETGTAFTALLPNRMKSGKMFINLLDLRGLTIARDANGEELWYLIGIQADVTGLSRNSIPGDHIPELQAISQKIREKLRKELSALAAEGVDRQSSSSPTRQESSKWELLKEPVWKCGSLSRSPETVAAAAMAQSSAAMADHLASASLARSGQGADEGGAEALGRRKPPLVERYWRLAQGRLTPAILVGGTLAFATGLLLGRGLRRSLR